MTSSITKFAHLQISLEDVVKATENFHDDNFLGHGEFGPAYKGQLLQSGKLMKIAALRLDRKFGLGDVEFWTEISVLSDLNHTNLVSLIGYCDEKDEKIIVITHEAKGSLMEKLSRPNLTWTQRLRISVGVARGLSYLHHEEGRGYGVIHRNLNSSTILLDRNWEPKLSGFLYSVKQSTNRMDQDVLCEPIAMAGYVDPSIEKSRGVTSKLDTYSLGVVLYEILCGKSAYMESEANICLASLAKYHYKNKTLKDIVHPALWNHMSPKSLHVYSKVAYFCLHEERGQRPETNDIVAELEKALELQLRRENIGKNLEHLKISLSDIKLATNDFSTECVVVRSEWCTVYRAKLDHFDEKSHSSIEGTDKDESPKRHDYVFIRRILNPRYDMPEEEAFYKTVEMIRGVKRGILPKDTMLEEEGFYRTVEALSSVKHRNIVTLHGICVEGSESIFVTDDAFNGYLGDHYLSKNSKRVLPWKSRVNICLDVAQALNYLHSEMEDQKVIISRGIQSNSIELDEKFRAKIVNFASSVFLPPNQKDEALYVDGISGPSYYRDPEYASTSKLKRESDVYSFGIVLFEVLCGRLANDADYLEKSDKGLALLARRWYREQTLEDMIDPKIKEEFGRSNFFRNRGHNSLHTIVEIAKQCIAETQDQRPTMKVVIKELKKALSFLENNKLDDMRISLEDIKLATNNFHDDHCIGGGGSFGKVYKGNFPQGNGFNIIIAKRLDTVVGHAENRFLCELRILWEYKHKNIIGLVGYCDEHDEKIIVYEYASRGSLDKYLNDASLTWIKRLNICIDVASALDFLHGGVGKEANVIIHRDIKTANILLNDEDWKAKLSGFGLALISPQIQETDNVIDRVCGTPGYLDPVCINSGFLTKESDIYSFGVILFEILSGRSTVAIDEHNGHYLVDFIRKKFEEGKHDEVVFEQIKGQIVPQSLAIFQTIAYQCLQYKREERPTTKEVLKQLKKALELQEQAPHQNVDQKMDQVVDKHQKTLEDWEKKLDHLKIRLDDIKLATKNFSKPYIIQTWQGEECILYRAELNHFDKQNPSLLEGKTKDERDNIVVIKRYPFENNRYREEKFVKEIEMLTSVKHHNIVTLLGFCVEDSEMILVTENASNGYLTNYLGNLSYEKRRVLTWEIRLKICIDIARALNYLHYEMKDQKTIINRDIDSYNIGLDENWGAKIHHFWFSVFLPPYQEDEALYVKVINRTLLTDPEYLKTRRLKRESDVYSFGVVLFEILCGRKANDKIYMTESEKGLASRARRSFCMGTIKDMIDPLLKEERDENKFLLNRGPSKNSLHTFIKIAYQCVSETQDQRPTMKVVIKELMKALYLQKNNDDNPQISLEDIKVATQNFHKDNCIGGGGFGRVFIGNLQDDNGYRTIVAKRLDTSLGQGEQQFLTELQILLEYKHENVIDLIGYCDEQDEKIIVFKYAPRGSLDRHLNKTSLTWVKRLNICIDVASALYFLHGGIGKQAKVIHRDIKAANILLNNEWKAELGDFGLSLISPLVQKTDYVIDHWCGTPGYLDPVYRQSGFLTIESDIYSFGVVMFEILCGKSTFETNKIEGQHLADFVKNKFEEGKHYEVVFENIKEHILPKSLTTFQEIAYKCLYHDREKRPTAKEVLLQLKKALKFQNMTSIMAKSAHLQIPLEDVIKATNNFHDDNIIKRGGFATTYKGSLLLSERLVKIAARRFHCEHDEGYLEFLTEVSLLSDLNHTNIVSIIGLCDEKEEKIIVTAYEPYGSLKQHLNDPNLTWTQRLRICVGVARALSSLLYDKVRDYAIVHGNINSDTILLDENREAKLSGFEMSIKQKEYYKDHVCLGEHIGTMGYMDPAIEKTGGVTHKSDIYSFGVVLFETLCGKKGNESNEFLAPLARHHYEKKTLHDIVHPDLYWNQMSLQSLIKFSNVAYACLNEDRAHRPSIDYIVEELEKALDLQQQIEHIGENLKHLKIRLSDIKLATNNFSEKYRIVSWDHCTWYRAELVQSDIENPKTDNTVVMKRYPSNRDGYGDEEFLTEIEMLTCVNHPNIITLLGFCVEHFEMIIVIENVSNGYLGHHYLGNVDRMRTLTWEKRLKICIDVALAIDYLHSEMEGQKTIINRDIHSRNIALDENLRAKIVDFWWSVFLPPNQRDEALRSNTFVGRWSYLDPEYKKTGKLKRESDVYSFGVVLFEILCDKGLFRLLDQNFCTGTVEEMIDPIIKDETVESHFALTRGPNKNSLHTFIDIAQQCVAETQDQRPKMKAVVKELRKALFFQVNNKDNPKIPLEVIKIATQNFHDDNCIGGEGFRKLYKGSLQDGDEVNFIVAKRLDKRDGQGEKQFFSELRILWEYKHENVIGLVGYCDEQDEKIIVYEYSSRGSLDRYLNDASLTWMKRLNICIDVASALDFLHGGVEKQAKVIHRDIKTANVLLNHDWDAKLANFELSLISLITQETDYVQDHACGTLGYIDPLYQTSRFLTIESDIYSFGVVLFEILYGRSTTTIHEHEGHYLPDFIKNKFEEGKQDEVVFEQLKEQIVPESLTTFQEIAYQCLHHKQEQRPSTEEVLMQLKMALAFQISKGE